MNCHFCQKPCTNGRNPLHFYCRPCWTTFYYNEQNELMWTELWTQIKDSKYMLRLFPQTQTTELRSAVPMDPKDPKGGYLHNQILELKYLAQITPINIQEKVKTMLTFL